MTMSFYRLFFTDCRGRITTAAQGIEAVSDDAAIADAVALAGEARFDLWQGNRRIVVIGRGEREISRQSGVEFEVTNNLYFDAEPHPTVPKADDPAPRPAQLAAQASAEARKARTALPLDRLSVWVVRGSNLSFVWEIRRYGALVVQRGTESYPMSAEARLAGEAVLATMLNG